MLRSSARASGDSAAQEEGKGRGGGAPPPGLRGRACGHTRCAALRRAGAATAPRGLGALGAAHFAAAGPDGRSLDAAAPAEPRRTRGGPSRGHAPVAPALQRPQDGRGKRGALLGRGAPSAPRAGRPGTPLGPRAGRYSGVRQGPSPRGPPARRRRGPYPRQGVRERLCGGEGPWRRPDPSPPDVPEPPDALWVSDRGWRAGAGPRRPRGSPGASKVRGRERLGCRLPHFFPPPQHLGFRSKDIGTVSTAFTSELIKQLIFKVAFFFYLDFVSGELSVR